MNSAPVEESERESPPLRSNKEISDWEAERVARGLSKEGGEPAPETPLRSNKDITDWQAERVARGLSEASPDVSVEVAPSVSAVSSETGPSAAPAPERVDTTSVPNFNTEGVPHSKVRYVSREDGSLAVEKDDGGEASKRFANLTEDENADRIARNRSRRGRGPGLEEAEYAEGDSAPKRSSLKASEDRLARAFQNVVRKEEETIAIEEQRGGDQVGLDAEEYGLDRVREAGEHVNDDPRHDYGKNVARARKDLAEIQAHKQKSWFRRFLGF